MRKLILYIIFIIFLFSLLSIGVTADLTSIKAHCIAHKARMDACHAKMDKLTDEAVKQNSTFLLKVSSLYDTLYKDCNSVYMQKCTNNSNSNIVTSINIDPKWGSCNVLLSVPINLWDKPFAGYMACTLSKVNLWQQYKYNLEELCKISIPPNADKSLPAN